MFLKNPGISYMILAVETNINNYTRPDHQDTALAKHKIIKGLKININYPISNS